MTPSATPSPSPGPAPRAPTGHPPCTSSHLAGGSSVGAPVLPRSLLVGTPFQNLLALTGFSRSRAQQLRENALALSPQPWSRAGLSPDDGPVPDDSPVPQRLGQASPSGKGLRGSELCDCAPSHSVASTASAVVLTSRPAGRGLGHGRLASHLGVLARSCRRPGQLGSASPAPRTSSPRWRGACKAVSKAPPSCGRVSSCPSWPGHTPESVRGADGGLSAPRAAALGPQARVGANSWSVKAALGDVLACATRMDLEASCSVTEATVQEAVCVRRLEGRQDEAQGPRGGGREASGSHC